MLFSQYELSISFLNKELRKWPYALRYDELQSLNKITDFYDYETEFIKIWQGFGWEVLEKNIGTLSKDKRKKKPHDTRLHNHQQ